MELELPGQLHDWYWMIRGYLESCKINPDSTLAKVSESILGEKGKDLSAMDALLFTMATTGTILASAAPHVGIPLAILGYIPMTYRRGVLGAALPPMVVYTAIKNPQLGAKLAQEAAETLGDTAREAVKLGFTVTGTIVTTTGAILAFVLTKGNPKKKET